MRIFFIGGKTKWRDCLQVLEKMTNIVFGSIGPVERIYLLVVSAWKRKRRYFRIKNWAPW